MRDTEPTTDTTAPHAELETTTEWDLPDWADLELADGTRVQVRVAGGQVQLEVTDTAGTAATVTLPSAVAAAVRTALDEAIGDAFAAEHATALAGKRRP